MANYFNTLSLREKLEQLGQCEFMDSSEFTEEEIKELIKELKNIDKLIEK